MTPLYETTMPPTRIANEGPPFEGSTSVQSVVPAAAPKSPTSPTSAVTRLAQPLSPYTHASNGASEIHEPAEGGEDVRHEGR